MMLKCKFQLQPHAIDQHCPMEFSSVMGRIYICAVQYGSYSPRVAIGPGNVPSAT